MSLRNNVITGDKILFIIAVIVFLVYILLMLKEGLKDNVGEKNSSSMGEIF